MPLWSGVPHADYIMDGEGKRKGPPPKWLVRQWARESEVGGTGYCDICGCRFTMTYLKITPARVMTGEKWICHDCAESPENTIRLETIRCLMDIERHIKLHRKIDPESPETDPELLFRQFWTLRREVRPCIKYLSDIFWPLMYFLHPRWDKKTQGLAPMPQYLYRQVEEFGCGKELTEAVELVVPDRLDDAIALFG